MNTYNPYINGFREVLRGQRQEEVVEEEHEEPLDVPELLGLKLLVS